MIRVGLIGGGAISEQHLLALAKTPNVSVTGICDLSEAMASYTGQRFGIPGIYTDYKEMLASESPQVVHVLTPPRTHFPITRDVLESGAHAIVEKPVALDHTEFLELWNFAKERNLHLIEDHNYRFNAPVQAILALAESGELGDIREVDVRLALDITSPGGQFSDRDLPHPSHKLPAGAIHEFLSHLVYLASLFLPKDADGPRPADRVVAMWRNYEGGDAFRYDDLDALIESQHSHARIRFSAQTWPETFELTVRGSAGEVSTDLFLPRLVRFRKRNVGPLAGVLNLWSNGWHLVRSAGSNFIAKLARRDAYEGLRRFTAETYRALEENRDPPIGFADMENCIRLIDELLQQDNQT